MRESEYPDCFVVVNGPEDGAEFPVVRAPFYIGRDAACTVNLRLDSAVRERHALVTVVSDGYRIRCSDTEPVFVNGKRAGMFKSRVARSGATVQVGQTLLQVDCVPDGLAARSHGIITENDLVWLLRQAFNSANRTGSLLLRFALRAVLRILRSWMLLLVIFGVLYFSWPAFQFTVRNTLRWAVYWLQRAMATL